MTSHLHLYYLALGLFLTVPSLTSARDKEATAGKDEWSTLLEEAESTADWAADPLADLDLFGNTSAYLVLTTSLRAGGGYSDNFLKRQEAVGGRYYHIEADLWLSWFMQKSTLTALFFGESNSYEGKVDVDDEYLAFAQMAWSLPTDSGEIGIEVTGFLADQIYDASLSPNGAPSGTRIRQMRSETSTYLDWFPGRRDRLRTSLSVIREEYNIEDEDYWEPLLGFEWERLWSKTLQSTTRMELSSQFLDDAVGLDAKGLSLAETRDLRIDRLLMEEQLKWQPSSLPWLEVSASAGLAWEEDKAGSYESLRQGWVSGRATAKGKWGQLKLTTRWREIRYNDRQVAYYDPTPVLHKQRSFQSEYKLPLPWSLAVFIRGEWIQLDSRVDDSRYKEQRGEVLFQWSY